MYQKTGLFDVIKRQSQYRNDLAITIAAALHSNIARNIPQIIAAMLLFY
jgi:hypothetical protein